MPPVGARPALTLADVLEARSAIAPYLLRTPLHAYPGLGELVGADVRVKHENHLPTGAFKVRGGINLVSHLEAAERARGLVTASTGNHGQSLGYAGRLFGAPVVVCVPVGANPAKLASMRALGVELVEHGRDFDEAREHCEALAETRGYRYVHSGNEPWLIAGVGTHTLEALEQEPRLDAILVPIGGGSGAAGACIVAKSVAPACEVIGVQAEAAPAAFKSWQARSVVEDRMGTAAEGLATRVGFELRSRSSGSTSTTSSSSARTSSGQRHDSWSSTPETSSRARPRRRSLRRCGSETGSAVAASRCSAPAETSRWTSSGRCSHGTPIPHSSITGLA